MRYVVLCHTAIEDRSATGRDRDRVVTKTILQCVNRRDAERMARILESADQDQTLEDGPLLISRGYEVAGELYSVSIHGGRKVTLTTAEMEMIASEYTLPMAAE